MVPDAYRARYRSAHQIRTEGAIGNLFDGVTITAHGLETRLLAWPGTGYQTEAVHVTTLRPGESSDRYRYDLSEEAILCRYGTAEVWLRDRWVNLRPGDMAYFPEGVEHQIRSADGADEDAVLVHQICPPQFDLYADAGFYNAEYGVMNHEAIEKAAINAPAVTPPEPQEMTYQDDQPEVRAQNLAPADVKAHGALFNVLEGAAFTGIGLPMRLVLWPGAGTRLVGFNYAYCGTGVQDAMHRHPVSDEFLVMWSGAGQLYVGDLGWVDAEENDVAMAPCGVLHGHRSTAELGPSLMGGFASPPQMDLVIPTPYYADGVYAHPADTRLTAEEEHAADLPVRPADPSSPGRAKAYGPSTAARLALGLGRLAPDPRGSAGAGASAPIGGAGMNEIQVTITGNVVSEVQSRVLSSGDMLSSFRLAVNPRRYDSKQGQWVDGESAYYTVTAWRVLAENIRTSLVKGMPVIVHGRLKQRTFEKRVGEESITARYDEIEARCVGPDLTRGTATFARTKKDSIRAFEAVTVSRVTAPAEPGTDRDADEAVAGGATEAA